MRVIVYPITTIAGDFRLVKNFAVFADSLNVAKIRTPENDAVGVLLECMREIRTTKISFEWHIGEDLHQRNFHSIK